MPRLMVSPREARNPSAITTEVLALFPKPRGIYEACSMWHDHAVEPFGSVVWLIPIVYLQENTPVERLGLCVAA